MTRTAPTDGKPGPHGSVAGQAVDVVALALLLTAALYGFGRAYGGTGYLVVGVLGVLVGCLVAVAADRLHAPVVGVVAVAVAMFFLLGGAVVFGGTGAVPSRTSLGRLADGALRGWAQLLTVLPPVGASGNLMAIPYLLGLFGAVAGYLLARRTRRSWPPLLPPVTVLGLSILFGTDEPASLLVQGVAFGVVALGWISLRGRRATALIRGGRRRTVVWAAGLLAVAAAGATVLGPQLPLADATPRVVLRDHVEPPFDPRDYPSPLSDYRKYVLTGAKYLRDQPLFTVTGLPGGALVRIATMDAYDGTVWNVAGGPDANAAGSGVYQRVGETIPTTVTGTRYTVTVQVQQYGATPGQVWLPAAGVVTAARFTGADAQELADTFRYNRVTDTGVTGTAPKGSSRGLHAGDTYQLDVVIPPAALPPAASGTAAPGGPSVAALDAAGPLQVTQPPVDLDVEAVKIRASELAGTATTPYARARAIADALRATGFLSDGGANQAPSLPGHFATRLMQLVARDQPMVGDAEQFSALMALMARQLDIPARVVLGVRTPTTSGGGTPVQVTGKDVTAWVEVGLDGAGWVPLFPTPETVRIPQAQPRPKPLPVVKEPPKAPAQSHLDLDSAAGGAPSPRTPDRPPTGLARLPVWLIAGAAVTGVPVVVLAAASGVVLGLKVLRRRRRRRRPDPVARIAGAWDELVDHARDGGLAVPDVATRRERATYLAGAPAATLLADRADRAVFGPGRVDPADVDGYWADVMTARSDLSRSLGARGRLQAALNLSSLRRKDDA